MSLPHLDHAHKRMYPMPQPCARIGDSDSQNQAVEYSKPQRMTRRPESPFSKHCYQPA